MTEIDSNPFQAPNEKFSSFQKQAPTSVGKRIVFWSISILAIGTLFALLIGPLGRGSGVREAARRSSCLNNLRHIAIALHNYKDQHGGFPPAYTVDENGSPLHSWRVLILPYIEQNALYESIDLTKPWHHPVNEKARKQMPEAFRCPSNHCPPGFTTYLANAWEKGAFVPGVGKSIEEFTDGPSNTIAVFEVKKEQAVEWMSVKDGDYQTFQKVIGKQPQPHASATNVAMVDGSARNISSFSKSNSDSCLPYFTIAEGDKSER